MLFARLRPKNASSTLPNGGTFCVGTYHMPCLFNVPPVMVMHTSLAIKHLAKLAGSDPLVFAGDFNFNPDSDCYKLAVEGKVASGPPRATGTRFTPLPVEGRCSGVVSVRRASRFGGAIRARRL